MPRTCFFPRSSLSLRRRWSCPNPPPATAARSLCIRFEMLHFLDEVGAQDSRGISCRSDGRHDRAESRRLCRRFFDSAAARHHWHAEAGVRHRGRNRDPHHSAGTVEACRTSSIRIAFAAIARQHGQSRSRPRATDRTVFRHGACRPRCHSRARSTRLASPRSPDFKLLVGVR
jgi:hypothetical protein